MLQILGILVTLLNKVTMGSGPYVFGFRNKVVRANTQLQGAFVTVQCRPPAVFWIRILSPTALIPHNLHIFVIKDRGLRIVQIGL